MSYPTIAETAIEALVWARNVILYFLSTAVAVVMALTAVYATLKLAKVDTDGENSPAAGFYAFAASFTIVGHLFIILMLGEYHIPYPEILIHVLVGIGVLIAAILATGWSIALVVNAFSFFTAESVAKKEVEESEKSAKKSEEDPVILEHPTDPKKQQ